MLEPAAIASRRTAERSWRRSTSRRATLTPNGSGRPVSSSHHSPRSSTLCEPELPERELALVDQQPVVRTPGGDLVRDLLERQLAIGKSPSTSRSVRKAVVIAPGNDDLVAAQVVEGRRFAPDHDRPVAGADARTVRQQRIVLLDERIGGERDRGHFEPGRPEPTGSASGYRRGPARTRTRVDRRGRS